MDTVVLGLGSNQGFGGCDSLSLLKQAAGRLASVLEAPVYSSVYLTKPMYVENQNDFYNMVMLGTISAEYTPHKLLDYIHRIEADLGRNRGNEIRFGPRSIDIDIEFYGDASVQTDDLEIPHPRLYERAFVLKPLLEILPKCSDAVKGEKLKKLENGCVQIPSDGASVFISAEQFFS